MSGNEHGEIEVGAGTLCPDAQLDLAARGKSTESKMEEARESEGGAGGLDPLHRYNLGKTEGFLMSDPLHSRYGPDTEIRTRYNDGRGDLS